MPKKRVSLTLEEKLVERIDSEAEENSVNRSQQVEEILTEYLEGRGLDTAVVLCGDPENKAMNEYRGRPVISHVLENLSEQGISRVFLLAGQNVDELMDELGSRFEGMELEYVSEDEPKGTAVALENISDEISGLFVTVNGHVIADVDIREMVEIHRDEDSISTMALTSVEDPSGYGVAKLKGRKILGFEEKPEGEVFSRLINAGRYIFDPDIFDRLDENSLEEVFEKLADNGELSGYIYGGRWKDLD
ncbi:sugar phosphate nucleotidyltransferase [Candidatus Nanosalina sp. VS9-1]|uniref:sugar phosphate nucleotidyltransferase n=1 Tax=Candidatus Nanosalina sp. VS9-1 TaxID=3388566 RepID=UPI0039DF86D0